MISFVDVGISQTNWTKAIDAKGEHAHDSVIWPDDYQAVDCGAETTPDITGKPILIKDTCHLTVSFEDLYIPITPPACFKILRRWFIANEDHPERGDIWEYVQIIKVVNKEAPNFKTVYGDQYFCSDVSNCGSTPLSLTVSATDDCTEEVDLTYFYEIDVFNDGDRNREGEGNDASGDYPLGTHRIRWTVEDGCGNLNTCDYLLVVEDCKKPKPYCLNGLAIDLKLHTGKATLSATDLDQGSDDNCGIETFLLVSPSQGAGQNTPPVQAAPALDFDCTQLGTQSVDFWVSDAAGNWDYCTTYVLIQDTRSICPDQPMSIFIPR